MKNNLHSGNKTKKSSVRARRILGALGAVAGLILAGFALAAGPISPGSPGPAPTTTSGQNPIAEKYKTLVLRVYFRDRAERDQLAQELSAEEVPTTGGFLTVIGDRDLYYNLMARGLWVEIDENSSRNLSDPQILLDTFYGGYKSVEEIYAFLDQKVAQFPNLAEKVDIGDSWCKSHPGSCVLPSPWNGYDLFVLHLTNRNIPGPKPVFWADGNIHAREIATPEVVMRMVDYLLNNYDTNADVHWLLDHHDIWLMPEANPDGHHIVEAGGGGNSPYLQRKNGNNSAGGACSWPPTGSNHSGVDNNRNFPFKWGCCMGSSGLVCDQTYRGPSAGSDPETMAIFNKIRTLVADQRGPADTDPAPTTATGVYQNLHTNAKVSLYPWGWTTGQMPNYAETRNIAAHMSATNAGGNGYPYGGIQEQLYPVDGGSIDWAYGELGMAAFTTEFGGSDFLPTYSCIDNPGCGSTQGIWPENRGMLLYLAKIARTPYLTSHGPDANNVVTNPASVPPGVPSQLTANITFVWTNNAFSQNVGAAEYYIDTPPWAGGTAIPMSGTLDSPTEAVNATINTASLSIGRHVIFVRGRGVNNFQGFETWGPISAAFLDVTGGPTPTPGPTSTPTATPGPTAIPTATPTATPVANATVLVGHNGAMTFEPALVNIRPGDTVKWQWESGLHSVTSGLPAQPDGLFNSGVQAVPFTFFHTFPAVGDFPYFCEVHGAMMVGSIHVTTATPTPAPTATSTPGPTATPAPTATPGPTGTPGASPTPTAGPTSTPVPTGTPGPTPTPGGSPAAQPLNLSTRMFVQTGDNVGIGGFIITGSALKHVLVRAVGPSLVGFGISNALPDTLLELHGPTGFVTLNNDNWRENPAQETLIKASGLAPSNDLESAIDVTLPPGAYTAIVKGKNNTTGVGVVEVFDLSQAVLSKMANISTRAFCGTGNDIVIAGFILGNSNVNDRVIIRGIGPSLAAFGVPNVLLNPALELRNQNGSLLMANNDWQDDAGQAAEMTAANLAPSAIHEAGIAASLPPGTYTALLFGENNGTGNGVVEVYDRGAP